MFNTVKTSIVTGSIVNTATVPPRMESSIPISHRIIGGILILLSLFLCAGTPPATAQTLGQSPPLSGASILLYHRFDNNRYPQTSISERNFQQQMAFLSQSGTQVLPLFQVAEHLKNGTPLPSGAVAITVDDGFRSFVDVALPILQRYNFPVTLFISTDTHDTGGSALLTWDQLRLLAEEPLVTLALAGSAHEKLTRLGKADLTRHLQKAISRYKTQLKKDPPPLFAYPYGETSLSVMKSVASQGFVYGFGQHSGVANTSINPLFYSRFSMSDSLIRDQGPLTRLQLVSQALPMAITDLTPADPLIRTPVQEISFRLWLPTGILYQRPLSCFLNGNRVEATIEPAPPVTMPNSYKQSASLPTVTVPLPKGDSNTAASIRLNCTYPSQQKANGLVRHYWFGAEYFFYNPLGR